MGDIEKRLLDSDKALEDMTKSLSDRLDGKYAVVAGAAISVAGQVVPANGTISITGIKQSVAPLVSVRIYSNGSAHPIVWAGYAGTGFDTIHLRNVTGTAFTFAASATVTPYYAAPL